MSQDLLLRTVGLCILVLLPTICTVTAASGKFRVCYFSWRENSFSSDDIDATLCTHYIMGFVGLDDYKISLDGVGGEASMLAFANLKERNPEAKILLSAGGGGGDGSSFGILSASEHLTQRFVEHLVELLRKYNFDGFDLDWEFPGAADKDNLIKLLKAIRAGFDAESDKLPSLLTVAVAAPHTLVVQSYDILGMVKPVDFVNLMTYDLEIYQWYYPFTGHNSALYKRSAQIGYFSTLNIEWCANNWVNRGMPKSKVMVGIPTYGLVWKLKSADQNGLGALAVGRGDFGAGFTDYPTVCKQLKEGYSRMFDKEGMAPYAFKDKEWISYDDEESIRYKVEWIKSQDFGGVMSFNLNSDDVYGTSCSNETFPLHKLMRRILEEENEGENFRKSRMSIRHALRLKRSRRH